MVVSADVYRPAAIEQLRTLAQQVDVMFFPSTAEQKPEAIVRAAIGDAKKSYADVLIVDTAGRLAIDEAMMAEIKRSEEHTSELQSLMRISYAVFCLKKKRQRHVQKNRTTTYEQTRKP